MLLLTHPKTEHAVTRAHSVSMETLHAVGV